MASRSFPPVAEIFRIFAAFAGQGEKLGFTRSFRGLSLKQGATITRVEEGKVYLKFTDCRAFACPDGPVYIQDRRISKPVRGSFHLDNSTTGAGVLSELGWMKRKWKERTCDRVQPRTTVHVEVECRNLEIRGNVENISASGMALLVNKSLAGCIDTAPPDKVLLDFTLQPGCEFHTLAAAVVYRQAVGSNLVRLGIKFIPYFEELTCLRAYVARRKAEILAELGQDYRDCETLSQVANLYF